MTQTQTKGQEAIKNQETAKGQETTKEQEPEASKKYAITQGLKK